MLPATLPIWSAELLRCPRSGTALRQNGSELQRPDGEVAGVIEDGIVRFPLPGNDPSISFYRSVGGAKFHERSRVAYAMTALDTSVYHRYLAELKPDDLDSVVVDVGGGDGRNAYPWLLWGYQKIVVVDVAAAGLARLRDRISDHDASLLDRVLLIEADVRSIPLRAGCADVVTSIEALAYLNEDYERGLGECARIARRGASLLVADRDHEGGLATRLLYGGGISGLLEQSGSRDIWDGNSTSSVRSRSFTAAEFAHTILAAGLSIVSHRGVSALSLLIGYLRNNGLVPQEDEAHLPQIHALLAKLGAEGSMRRSHVIVARRD